MLKVQVVLLLRWSKGSRHMRCTWESHLSEYLNAQYSLLFVSVMSWCFEFSMVAVEHCQNMGLSSSVLSGEWVGVCVVGGGWCGASSGRKTISLQDNTRAAAVADWSSGSQWTCKKFSPVSVQSVVSERGIHWCIYPLNRPMLRHLCFICHRHPTRPSHFCKITFKDVNVDKFKINCQVFICCVQLCLKLLHKHVLRATSSPISPPHFAVAFGYFLY